MNGHRNVLLSKRAAPEPKEPHPSRRRDLTRQRPVNVSAYLLPVPPSAVVGRTAPLAGLRVILLTGRPLLT